MAIYSQGKSLQLIKENQFKYEKEIQQMVENNITTLLNLVFIKSDYSLNNLTLKQSLL